jgi:hypothetical protein
LTRKSNEGGNFSTNPYQPPSFALFRRGKGLFLSTGSFFRKKVLREVRGKPDDEKRKDHQRFREEQRYQTGN